MAKRQRIMVDGGFSCPNRRYLSVQKLNERHDSQEATDSREDTVGCTYCRNDSFAPDYCRRTKSIRKQIEEGKKFFGKRYKDMKYVAYFQSYSGTYAPVDVLRERYSEALGVEDVVGLVIATRPDCLGNDVLDLLEEFSLQTDLTIEIGIESCHDHVLRRINRGHDFAIAAEAVNRLAERGIKVGVHIILGLPEESIDEMLEGADILSRLPIEYIKLHQLQILKNTRMADDYEQHPSDFVTFPKPEDYISLVKKYRSRLRPDIRIDRYVSSVPSSMLIAPRWGLKPYQIKELMNS